MKIYLCLVTIVLCTLVHSVISHDKKVVCYYGSWSTYRPGDGKCVVEDIDPTLCTHLMYTFIGLREDGEVFSIDPWCDFPDGGGLDGFARFRALKQRNPNLKTLIALGGWNEGSIKYSKVVNDPALRSNFVRSAFNFVMKYQFDGLDFDWEYPNQRGGIESDKEAYIETIKELHQAFQPFGLLLTAAVGAAKKSASQSYIIKEMNEYLDIITLMAYDLHGSWDDYVGINAPLYPRSDESDDVRENLNVDACVKYWLTNGGDPNKLVLGMPLYGRTFTLADESKVTPGSPAEGPGLSGQWTQEPGMIGYNEIVDIQNQGWTQIWDQEQQGAYMYKGKDWIGYDNVASVRIKTEYAMRMGLAGVSVWSVETDTIHGSGSQRYILLNAINDALNGIPSTSSPRQPTSQWPPFANTTTSMTTVVPNPGAKICKEEGWARDPVDCSIFYRCVYVSGEGLHAYQFQCPDGLYFNIVNANCDYKENVDC